MTTRRLGKTEIELTPIGLGCWQFSQGKGIAGGYWAALDQQLVDSIVAATLRGGVNWFDTAEAYGRGASEHALAHAIQSAGSSPGDLRIATKWMPIFRRAANIPKTIGDRIAALDPFPIDLYQIHNPASFSSVEAQMQEMADLVEAGKIRAVGVSNFSAEAMRVAHRALAARGIPLASNQVRYSLLDRRIDSNGVMEAARELGISIIAYSPLSQGLLTGVFHDDPELIRSRGGPRKWLPRFRASGLEQSRPLIELLRAIAADHNCSAAQIALAWTIRDPLLFAIPGATKIAHAESNAAAMQIELDEGEIRRLDEASGSATRNRRDGNQNVSNS